MDEASLTETARALAAQIQSFLDDPRTEQILLSRDEAAQIQGILDRTAEEIGNGTAPAS